MSAAVAQNWLATIALLVWPLVGLWLYKARPVGQATLLTILGGYLLLPVGASVKIAEGIPQLDKVSVPAITAFLGCLLFSRPRLKLWNGFGLSGLLFLVFLFSPLVTSLLNSDPVMSGSVLLPGVGTYDGLSTLVSQFFFVIPVLLGRLLFRDNRDIELLLRVLVWSGLLYSIPMLFEILMSPQLHYWIYGYYPFGFNTEMRYGGFRPCVFLDNGLVASFFLMTAVVAAAACWRAKLVFRNFPSAAFFGYLGAVLALCKSLGVLVYAIVLVPLIRFASPQLQLRVAIFLAAFALSYPLLRMADRVPTDLMVAAARYANDERAGSLQFRFDQEKQLLDRASERILFGWGRFGRNRVFDEWGKDSVTDGLWIIALGQYGLVGFLAEFGLLALAVFRGALALKFAKRKNEGIFLAALALIIAINMIDLLPNASLSPWTWLLAGSLIGRAESLRDSALRLRRRPRTIGIREAPPPIGEETQAVTLSTMGSVPRVRIAPGRGKSS